MIETKRLILRPLRIDDFESYKAVWINKPTADPDACSQSPLSEEQIWDRLLRWIGHWTTFDHGPFAVVERATDTVVGEVGLAHFRRGHGPAYDGVPEAMWRIEHSRHGRGIASEAAEAALAWFDARQISGRSVCMIDTWNDASMALARKLGYRQFMTATYKGNAVLLFERTPGSARQN